MRPSFPAITEEIVAVLLVPRALTVIVGVPAVRSSVRILAPEMVQLAAEEISPSPKVMLPIVRTASRVTMRSAVMSLVKFAVKSAPLAALPLVHLVESDQLALPILSKLQVPLSAEADETAPTMIAVAARSCLLWNRFL